MLVASETYEQGTGKLLSSTMVEVPDLVPDKIELIVGMLDTLVDILAIKGVITSTEAKDLKGGVLD